MQHDIGQRGGRRIARFDPFHQPRDPAEVHQVVPVDRRKLPACRAVVIGRALDRRRLRAGAGFHAQGVKRPGGEVVSHMGWSSGMDGSFRRFSEDRAWMA